MGGLQGFGMGKQFEAMDQRSAMHKAQMEELARKTKAGEEQAARIAAFGASLPEAERPAFMANPNAYLEAFYKEKLDTKPLIVPPGAAVMPRGASAPTFTAPFKPEGPHSDIGKILADVKAGIISPEQGNERIQRINTPPQPLVNITTGDKKVDEKFAGDFVEFATGGYADVQKQIQQLEGVAGQLARGEGLTGPVVGAMPRHMMAVMNPKALSAMEAVEEVGQRNLRLVLGAQFTEKEGDRLISRVYNPMLPESENLKRVNRLAQQIRSAAEAKLEAAKYFQEHGTLKGWKGKLWTIKDFNIESDGANDSGSGWSIKKK
jgi:hypothetical protein